MSTLKKTYEEHLDSYIKTTVFYACPYLKDAKAAKDQSSLYAKAFGPKQIGSNFEKMVKRVNKHLCKEFYIYSQVVSRLKQTMQKMVKKAIKEVKITSPTQEQFEYFMNEEGQKIVSKYSIKK